jgi:hypothetical protein
MPVIIVVIMVMMFTLVVMFLYHGAHDARAGTVDVLDHPGNGVHATNASRVPHAHPGTQGRSKPSTDDRRPRTNTIDC